MKWTGDTLSKYFAGNFWHFTAEKFKIIGDESRCTHRDLLRNRGVYVAKKRNTLIREAIFDVAQTEILWPEGKHQGEYMSLAGSVGSSKTVYQAGAAAQYTLQVYKTSEAGQSFTTARIAYKNGILPNPFKKSTNDDDWYCEAATDTFEDFVLFKVRCDKADGTNN